MLVIFARRIINPSADLIRDVCKIEGQIPLEFGQDATEIPGSRALLEHLGRAGAPWAIVTSGTKPLVYGWLDVMKLAYPKRIVVAEDVTQGKPDPSCFLMGRSKLGLSDGDALLVLEDSPAGVRAGKAAGFRVVGLATTHEVTRLQEAGADWIVQDMRSVTLMNWSEKTRKISVKISHALRI